MARLRALRSTRQRSLRKKRAIWVAAAWVFALGSLGSAVGFLFNSPFVRISAISVEGGTAADDSRVQSIISTSIDGDYLWLIPKDSAFFFPSRTLSRTLPVEFPSVLSVSFSRPSLTAVAATVIERTPYAIACIGDGAASPDGSDCYYADDNGVIFASATTTDGAFMVYNISLPPGADPLGLQFIDGGRLSALSDFAAGLARIGFVPRAISILPGNSYDFDLATVGWVSAISSSTASSLPDMHLLIDESRPFAETLQDFAAFWQVHTEAAEAGKEKPALQQVDMRYGNNIVYK